MYYDALRHSSKPDAYPLGLNGFGAVTDGGVGQPPPRGASSSDIEKYVRKLWANVQDQSNVTSADYNTVERLLNNRDFNTALVVIGTLKSGATRSTKGGLSYKSMTEIVPEGWRLTDELIKGVPNWTIYLTAGAAVVLAMRKKKR